MRWLASSAVLLVAVCIGVAWAAAHAICLAIQPGTRVVSDG